MKIGFFGATGEVTGSCFIVEAANKKILVDCGYFQGQGHCSQKNYEPFGFDPKEIDAVLITHAHLDHTGRLPKLTKEGFTGPIYSTLATKEISELILEDSQQIMLEESEDCSIKPLYEEIEIDKVTRQWKPIEYRNAIQIAPGIVAKWHDAGHILGSAFITIKADNKHIAFSGDVGSAYIPLLPDTEELPKDLDLLICESTYGDRLHSKPKERINDLRQIIQKNTENKGVLMIPAFSVERTQEILFELNLLIDRDHIRPGQVYLDSPLAIATTRVYSKHQELLELDGTNGFKDDDMFHFKSLNITTTVQESKAINNSPSPKVIVAGAGMMNAGRIQHHIIRYLDDPNNTLLIIGYQAEGTLGRKIQDGITPVHLMGYSVDVKATIITMDSYSGHADYDKLTDWIKRSKTKNIALIHGEQKSRETFKKHLIHQGIESVTLPDHGTWLEV